VSVDRIAGREPSSPGTGLGPKTSLFPVIDASDG
jgi:hypothetical protein